jgi:hypothetical protein
MLSFRQLLTEVYEEEQAAIGICAMNIHEFFKLIFSPLNTSVKKKVMQ